MEPEGRPKLALATDASFAALVRSFMSPANPKWVVGPPMGYAEKTKDMWGRELRFMAHPDCLGSLSREEIRPSLVQAYFDGIAEWPAKQAVALTALKQLEKWAVVRDLLPRQITLGVETGDMDGGYIPWDESHVILAEKHARPDLARAVTLGANTGQRGSDLVRMGPTDVEVFKGINGIRVFQKKTGREVWIPITSPLATAMDTWERVPGPYLRRPSGLAWSRRSLTKAWAHERDTNPALEPLRYGGPNRDTPLVLHGLRAHACVRLLRAGANTRQISDMVGMSEPMVARYTRFSLQRENASAAVYHLERTIKERLSGVSDKTG